MDLDDGAATRRALRHAQQLWADVRRDDSRWRPARAEPERRHPRLDPATRDRPRHGHVQIELHHVLGVQLELPKALADRVARLTAPALPATLPLREPSPTVALAAALLLAGADQKGLLPDGDGLAAAAPWVTHLLFADDEPADMMMLPHFLTARSRVLLDDPPGQVLDDLPGRLAAGPLGRLCDPVRQRLAALAEPERLPMLVDALLARDPALVATAHRMATVHQLGSGADWTDRISRTLSDRCDRLLEVLSGGTSLGAWIYGHLRSQWLPRTWTRERAQYERAVRRLAIDHDIRPDVPAAHVLGRVRDLLATMPSHPAVWVVEHVHSPWRHPDDPVDSMRPHVAFDLGSSVSTVDRHYAAACRWLRVQLERCGVDLDVLELEPSMAGDVP